MRKTIGLLELGLSLMLSACGSDRDRIGSSCDVTQACASIAQICLMGICTVRCDASKDCPGGYICIAGYCRP